MKKVFLTGSTGFIGQHAIDMLLSRGFEVHAITRSVPNVHSEKSGLYWHKEDLLDIGKIDKLMSKIQPGYMLHFAWHAVPKEYWTSAENIRWVQASLELLRTFIQYGGKRVVMAGSCAEYDWDYGYCSEKNTPLEPSTLYGISKHSLQLMLDMYAIQSGISSAWGRIFFLFGPNEHSSRLVPYIISSLLKNEQAICKNGNLVRDFLYVEDVASAFVSLLDSSVEGPVNISSGKPVLIKEVALKIGERLQGSHLIKVATQPSKNEPALLVGDEGRLTNDLKWAPSFDLTTGIDKTIAWWKGNLKINKL